MKSRYVAAVSIGGNQPALHVAGSNHDFVWDTAQQRAAALAAQQPGVEVRAELSRWERGTWAWLNSATHLVLQTLPEDGLNGYSTCLGSDRTN
jgi:hypothetical protein